MGLNTALKRYGTNRPAGWPTRLITLVATALAITAVVPGNWSSIQTTRVADRNDAPQAAPTSPILVAARQAGVRRLSGDSRAGTAAAVSAATAGESAAVTTVVIATARSYPDALASAPLAAALGAPILLTDPTGLSAPARGEVGRLQPRTAIIVGGTSAVSQQVVADLRALGVAEVQRVAGSSRYATAASLGRNVRATRPGRGHVFVVEGANAVAERGWPDAVAVSALAAREGDPILLVETSRLPAETATALRELDTRSVTVVGGLAAVSGDIENQLRALGMTVDRLSGPTRYETSIAVAQRTVELGSNPAVTWLATGRNWPDALAAGPAAAAATLLLIDGQSVEGAAPVLAWLSDNEVTDVTLVGGTNAISSDVEDAVRTALTEGVPPPLPVRTPPPTVAPVGPGGPSGLAGDIVVDVRQRFQVIDGFGASTRVWDDTHLTGEDRSEIPLAAQEQIMADLYGDLGLTRIRPVLDADMEPVNDNNDPFTLDPSALNFAGRRSDAHIEVVRQALAAGADVFFPAPLVIEPWMGDNVDEYVEWALTRLLHWRDAGVEPPFYSVFNEPGLTNAVRRPAWMVEAVARLGPRMRAAGLRTMLVIPDDVSPERALRGATAVLADDRARPYVGALAYHPYRQDDIASDIAQIRALGDRYNLPVWMTEYGLEKWDTWPVALEWADSIQQFLTVGGVNAIDYLFAFFGDWVDGGTLVSIEDPDGRYASHRFTAAGNITGQFSRYVPPGAVRVAADTQTPQVAVTAFARPDGQIAVVLINNGSDRDDLTLAINGAPARGTATITRTSATESNQSLPNLPLTGNTMTIDLAPQSVTTILVPSN